jgi:hypothetical protein
VNNVLLANVLVGTVIASLYVGARIERWLQKLQDQQKQGLAKVPLKFHIDAWIVSRKSRTVYIVRDVPTLTYINGTTPAYVLEAMIGGFVNVVSQYDLENDADGFDVYNSYDALFDPTKRPVE